MRIDLVRLSPDPTRLAPLSWPLGKVWARKPVAAELALFAVPEGAEFLLFWAEELGEPDPGEVAKIAGGPGEIFHAGLLLGQNERPRFLDFVHPTWMLHRDPPVEISASSWRISLRALLVPAARWQQAGPKSTYLTLDAAALELGWRWLWQGALLRHEPRLLPENPEQAGDFLPFEDELRFVHDTCGRKWAFWATFRAALSGGRRWSTLWRAWRSLGEREKGKERDKRDIRDIRDTGGKALAPEVPFVPDVPFVPSVTVLIPTLDRYAYLLVLLEQLTNQSLPPLEVLVIDQTPQNHRRHDLPALFPQLPLRVLEQDEPGQCSSRNAGLLAARGDFVLFLDDDDEIAPDLIARHLERLHVSQAEVSCGVADEVGAGPLPEAFRQRRLADVFPTNNSLLRRQTLERTGLFDLAYEKGARADADLGHRLYLSGALMVLDPELRVLHHHAPVGGLRKHGARKATFAASRQRLFARHLPEPTEIYLMFRYFSRRQVREALWLRAAGTFAVRGGPLRRLVRFLWALLLLPDTVARITWRRRRALAMLASYPRIPFPSENPP